MALASPNVNKWKVKVQYQSNGALKATATGVLLVPPQDALAFVTDTAGDRLFKVVERTSLPDGPQGSKRVEVVNKAAIRVLAWKLWSTSNVIYEIEPSNWKDGEASGRQEALLPFTTSSNTEEHAEHVTFDLVSSNMLQSLKGTWKLQPIRLHHSMLAQHISPASTGAAHEPTSTQTPSIPNLAPLRCGTDCKAPLSILSTVLSPRKAHTGNKSTNTFTTTAINNSNSKEGFVQRLVQMSPRRKADGACSDPRPVVAITACASSSSDMSGGLFGAGSLVGGMVGSSISTNGHKEGTKGALAAPQLLPPGLMPDAGGFVTATLVEYEQLAQPKGMHPSVRFVPGLSDAVAASVGREVRQMLDKVSCVSDVAVTQGLRPQEALSFVVAQMEGAGGSFKALQKQMRKQQKQQLKQAASAGPAVSTLDHDFNLLLAGDATAIASTLNLMEDPLEAAGQPVPSTAADKLISHPVLLTDPEYLE